MNLNKNEQHGCYITLFNHFMDNEADKGSPLQWWLFKKHISHHRSTNDKTQTLAFNTWMFKDTDYRPATKKDGNERIVKYKNGETIRGRYADNCVECYAILLDFDSGFSIADAKKRFKNYEYLGYTSFNHRTQKYNYIDRFRMVFPLAKPIPLEDYKKIKKSLVNWVDGTDRTAFDLAHIHAGHSSTQEQSIFAECWANSGQLLKFEDFEIEVIEHAGGTEAPTFDTGDLEREHLLNELANIYNVDYDVWRNIGWAMNNNGFSFCDFKTLTHNLRGHRENNATESVWCDGSGKDMNMGVLINIIKENNPVYKPYASTRRGKRSRKEFLIQERLKIIEDARSVGSTPSAI